MGTRSSVLMGVLDREELWLEGWRLGRIRWAGTCLTLGRTWKPWPGMLAPAKLSERPDSGEDMLSCPSSLGRPCGDVLAAGWPARA